jgi:hypothetical protein
VSRIVSLPWPTECAVEHLLDGTQGDPIVLGSDEKVEARERPIKELGLGLAQVFELPDVEPLPQLFPSAHLLSTCVAASCAILMRECVSYGAVFEQGGLFTGPRPARRSRRWLRVGGHALIVGVLWTMLWEK